MREFLTQPTAQLAILCAVCAALVASGVYVVKKVRVELRETEPGASDLLTKFGEMHSQGELSDDEYRTIKTMLANRLDQELKRSGEEG